MHEILQIAMNPARAFVTHIGKTLKNGTGFQATCKNMTNENTKYKTGKSYLQTESILFPGEAS